MKIRVPVTVMVEIDPDVWANEYAVGRDDKDTAVRADIRSALDPETLTESLNDTKAFGPVVTVASVKIGRMVSA